MSDKKENLWNKAIDKVEAEVVPFETAHLGAKVGEDVKAGYEAIRNGHIGEAIKKDWQADKDAFAHVTGSDKPLDTPKVSAGAPQGKTPTR